MRPKANLGASVRARLLNKAKAEKTEFGLLLIRFALERLLYRLSISPHRERFLLKGARRTVANSRRQIRHERILPPLTHFGDHLTPAVLLSMNTGLRRGEAVKLRWGSVDFNRRLVTVEGRNAKNRQTRHVPLNDEAVRVLQNWREQSGAGARVFDVATGFQAAWEKILKRAGISNFRWHDLRHHFASRLVQHGVPLNTVRDLLGHSTVGMSLRYAHLAPDQRREAVAKLNERRLLTLTMRLQWDGSPAVSRYVLCPFGHMGFQTIPPEFSST